jgi:hypothetical protein
MQTVSLKGGERGLPSQTARTSASGGAAGATVATVTFPRSHALSMHYIASIGRAFLIAEHPWGVVISRLRALSAELLRD